MAFARGVEDHSDPPLPHAPPKGFGHVAGVLMIGSHFGAGEDQHVGRPHEGIAELARDHARISAADQRRRAYAGDRDAERGAGDRGQGPGGRRRLEQSALGLRGAGTIVQIAAARLGAQAGLRRPVDPLGLQGGGELRGLPLQSQARVEPADLGCVGFLRRFQPRQPRLQLADLLALVGQGFGKPSALARLVGEAVAPAGSRFPRHLAHPT